MKLIAAVPAGFCHGHVKNELPNFRQRKSPDVIAHSRIGSVVRDLPSVLSLYPQAHVEIFEGMNHGQLLVDHPEEIVQRIIEIEACGQMKLERFEF